jgi:tetratricopeptide (TPR) repeat protein
MVFKKGLILLFFGLSSFMFGQTKSQKQINSVFDQLVVAFGNSKPAPVFKIRDGKSAKPAEYSTKSTPTILIDSYVYEICRSYGKDSLNSLSIILSHELVHYYEDHTFCADYAVATRYKNKTLAPKLIKSSLVSSIEKETEADQKGLFYASAAGYSPFGLYANLITQLYKDYKFPNELPGYPSKQERIIYEKNAEVKAKELYGYFQSGLKAMEEKKYNEAIIAFKKANSFIPYRENFNNLGVAKTRKALDLKEPNAIEKASTERFLYPIEIENKSRLNKEITRSLDDSSEEIEQLLKEAQNDFQEAIRLDPNFTKGYINLACVMDLLGDPEGAISKVTKQLLPKDKRESVDAQRILAIAYFHSNVKEYQEKADAIWKQLGK